MTSKTPNINWASGRGNLSGEMSMFSISRSETIASAQNPNQYHSGKTMSESMTEYGRIQTSARGELRVSLKEFKDKRYLDIRRYEPGRGDEIVPTKKGVAIPLDLTGELFDIMDRARAELLELG
jgi:hypothetical protein